MYGTLPTLSNFWVQLLPGACSLVQICKRIFSFHPIFLQRWKSVYVFFVTILFHISLCIWFYFVVREKSFGLGIFPRFTAASFLIDVSARCVIVIALTEGERTSVQWNSDNQFLSGAAFFLPQQETVVLQM